MMPFVLSSSHYTGSSRINKPGDRERVLADRDPESALIGIGTQWRPDGRRTVREAEQVPTAVSIRRCHNLHFDRGYTANSYTCISSRVTLSPLPQGTPSRSNGQRPGSASGRPRWISVTVGSSLAKLSILPSDTMRSAQPQYRIQMPLTVFDCKGVQASQRELIEAAVEAAGHHLSQPYEAWIAAEPHRGGVRVLITGPQGFDRTVTFDVADDVAVIAERIRETIQD